MGIGSVNAVLRHCRDTGKKLRVSWLDTHADFNPSALPSSGKLHGMPVARLGRFGPRALIEIGGSVPAIGPKAVRQIGTRNVDTGEKRLGHDADLDIFELRCIDEVGLRHAMALALATIDANAHLHVRIDVDVLDAAIAPGVGTTVRGGPTDREAQWCMELMADTGRLASLDSLEPNPAIDVRDATALLAVDPVECLLGKSTLIHG